MSNPYSKQDSVVSRTPAHLERQYNFGRSFAEVMGIAQDAQTHAYNAEKSVQEWSQKVGDDFSGIYGELALKIDKDDDSQIVSMLNATADVIKLKSNNLEIQSDNFTLTKEGVVTAKKGILGNWDIAENGIWKTSDKFAVHINAPTKPENYVFSVATFDNTIQTMPFYVRADGYLFAKNAYIEGEINATSGYFEGEVKASTGSIGGWNIKGTKLFCVDNDNVGYGIGLNCNPSYFNNSERNYNIFAIGKIGLKPNGEYLDGIYTWDNAAFRVLADGTLIASKAEIEGIIKAKEGGTLGAWTIKGDCLEAKSSYGNVYEKIQLSPIGIKLWVSSTPNSFATEPTRWATWNNLIWRVADLYNADFDKWW